ncbi:unnamed protein product [Mytilus coruscus]|uniref:TTF-type domain-containing protein n=1 Tax=Mytilus coruscus TaxID=42192 RepID=A0A6J8A5G2_MYTCO|nr:unnamed protein product [Mytilus coruscus]
MLKQILQLKIKTKVRRSYYDEKNGQQLNYEETGIHPEFFGGNSSKRQKSDETGTTRNEGFTNAESAVNDSQKAVGQSESHNRSQGQTPNDVTSCFGRTLNDDEKYTKGVSIPDTFKFPSTKIADKNRCFRREWISKYPGLVYSIEEDGAYCLHCVLFEKEPEKRGKLVNAPFKNWKRALEVFDEHFWGKSTKV